MTMPQPVWRAVDIDEAGFGFEHPLDPSCKCKMSPVSRMAGLTDVAVNVVTIAPGDQGFPHHTHHGEEEWVYVISGSAEVHLGDDVHALSAGDFVAFYKSGPAHSVKNSGIADLVCLMGGHQVPAKVIDLPDVGKRVTFTEAGWEEAPLSAFAAFAPPSPSGSKP